MYKHQQTTSSKNKNKAPSQQLMLQAVRDTTGHLPMLQQLPITHTGRLRFVSTSAFNALIPFSNLVSLLATATSATTWAAIFRFVRLKFVEVWVPALQVNGSSGTPTQCSVSYVGTDAGSDGSAQVYADQSMGVSPAHVYAPVPQKALASRYQNGTDSGGAFFLSCPAGAIIDLGLILRNQYGQAPLTGACVGATVGAQYFRGLDNLPAASTQLPAQAFGFNTI